MNNKTRLLVSRQYLKMSKLFIVFVALCTIFKCVHFGNGLKIAVIGAGASGLASTKLAIEKRHKVTTYEQNEAVGGTWWYTDEVGKNKYGIPVHTAAYQGLRAQVPETFVQFPGHKYPNEFNEYPSRDDIWRYLESYANLFDLKKHIKFLHQVKRVEPIANDKWNVTVKDLVKKKSTSNTFDAVFVCNGQNFKPYIPKFTGADKFKGKKMHSHDYRKAAEFKDKGVMVIGDGLSGRDIVRLLSGTANKIILVTHTVKVRPRQAKTVEVKFEEGHLREGFDCLTETGVDFPDGTTELLDAVIYATGYDFAYPFLDTDCGLTWKDNHVQPLFKQIFNIKYPTMIFIGLPSQCHSFELYYFQAECALAILSGKKQLPSKEVMEADRIATMKKHFEMDNHKRHAHQFALGEYTPYLSGLTKLTGVGIRNLD